MITKASNAIAETPLELSDGDIAELAHVFKVLGDESRLRMVLLLCRGEQSVVELCRIFDMSQPLVSHHLGLLRDAGVLEVRREGRHNFHSLRREHFQQLMDALFLDELDKSPCDHFLECVFR